MPASEMRSPSRDFPNVRPLRPAIALASWAQAGPIKADLRKFRRAATIAEEMKTQLTFIFLQAADVATTMTALQMGGDEKNPLVMHLMPIGSLQGLILSKVIVLAVAVAAVLAGKYHVLRWSNALFAGVVVWNLIIITRLALGAHGA